MNNNKRIFKFEKSKFKEIKYIYTTPFEFSSQGLDNNSLYKIVYSDVFNKYQRMNDKNVLYPMIFDIFNNPFNEDLRYDYYEMLSKMKIGFDIDKTIYLDDLNNITFVQKVFLNLYKKNIIKYEERKVYCDFSNTNFYLDNDIYESDLNFYLKETDEEVFGKISKVFILDYSSIIDKLKDYDDIIKNISYNTGLKMTLNSLAGHNLDVKIDYPSYLASVNFICLNPLYIDVLKYTSKSEYDVIESHTLKSDKFSYVTGITFINPLTGKDIYVFSSYAFDTDIHIGYSSMFNEDIDFCLECEIEKQEIISNGYMINSDFLTGLSVSEACDVIVDAFLEEEMAMPYKIYKNLEIVISSNAKTGILIPYYVDSAYDNYVLEANHYPVYYKDQYKILINNDESLLPGNVIRMVFTSSFVNSLAPMFARLYDKNIEEVSIDYDNKSLDIDIYCHKHEIPLIVIMSYLVPNIININEIKYCMKKQIEHTPNFSNNVIKEQSVDSYRLFLLTNDITLSLNEVITQCKKYDRLLCDMLLYFKTNIIDFNSNEMGLTKLVMDCKNLLHHKLVKEYALKVIGYFDILKNYQITKYQAKVYIILLSLITPNIAQEINDIYKFSDVSIFYSEFPN